MINIDEVKVFAKHIDSFGREIVAYNPEMLFENDINFFNGYFMDGKVLNIIIEKKENMLICVRYVEVRNWK